MEASLQPCIPNCRCNRQRAAARAFQEPPHASRSPRQGLPGTAASYLRRAMSAAAAFPSWAILEPFVFRRDDDESFPDETKAPIRASATTSWGAPFRIAFSFAEPPLISRLYAQLPDFPDPKKQTRLAILSTHRHLALLRVARGTVQDLFVYSGDDSSELQLLPSCPPLSQKEGAQQRLLAVRSMGILCRGGEEFAVAELMLSKPSRRRNEVFADICVFKSSTGKWESMRVSIGCDGGDIWQLGQWQTDAVVSVDGWLCWVDYYRGILFCDVLTSPAPSVFFHLFPLREFPCAQSRGTTSSWLYRGVSAIDAGRKLKFVDVARDDGIGYGELKPGAGFTITCHTLQLVTVDVFLKKKKSTVGSSLVWHKDGMAISSDELWSANPPERLPRGVLLMFPQVDIDRPHVVHFIIREDKFEMKKMWLVAVDMNTGIVESFSQYVNGREDIGTVDADLTEHKSMCPKHFLQCDFSKYLH